MIDYFPFSDLLSTAVPVANDSRRPDNYTCQRKRVGLKKVAKEVGAVVIDLRPAVVPAASRIKCHRVESTKNKV